MRDIQLDGGKSRSDTAIRYLLRAMGSIVHQDGCPCSGWREGGREGLCVGGKGREEEVVPRVAILGVRER